MAAAPGTALASTTHSRHASSGRQCSCLGILLHTTCCQVWPTNRALQCHQCRMAGTLSACGSWLAVMAWAARWISWWSRHRHWCGGSPSGPHGRPLPAPWAGRAVARLRRACCLRLHLMLLPCLRPIHRQADGQAQPGALHRSRGVTCAAARHALCRLHVASTGVVFCRGTTVALSAEGAEGAAGAVELSAAACNVRRFGTRVLPRPAGLADAASTPH
jgi:hypothetical protein